MTIYRFDKITAKRTASGGCPGCGKRVRRSKTFEMTVNPFNRNSDGSVRTPSEVRAAVEARADDWQPDFTCSPCGQEGE